MGRTACLVALVALCFMCSTITECNSAKILGLFTSPGKSHLIIHMAIAKALADAGHNVTVVATMPYNNKDANYRFIKLDLPRALSPTFMAKLVNEPRPFYQIYGELSEAVLKGTNETFYTPEMKKLMAEESFDLVIMGYFYNDFQMGIAAHFKCPIILSFMFQPVLLVNDLIGNPAELSYVPAVYTGLKQPMGFVNRAITFVYTIFVEGVLFGLTEFKQKKYYESIFPPGMYPSYYDIKKNVSLILVNHHFSQGPIRPNVPGMIEVGGIMIKEQPDPLPENLKVFLDFANETGAIYFSLGTNVAGSAIKKDKLKIMFDVLSKLKQKVLWKWDTEDYPGISENILYQSWVPQDDILAHPNVKLFVTHGGQGSVVESEFHGVPMVGIPFFGDQHSNVVEVKKNGFGLGVDYITMTKESFENAVTEVLNNGQYTENVKNFAKIYKDRPMSPAKTVVYWSEYVMRHGGAKHMQSPILHMNLFQRLSVDVVAFLVGVLLIVVYIIYVIFKFICKKTCRKNTSGKSKTN